MASAFNDALGSSAVIHKFNDHWENRDENDCNDCNLDVVLHNFDLSEEI
ncbi:MAG: hypothetical protein RLY19_315, partial [Actinomycetota bacterium]